MILWRKENLVVNGKLLEVKIKRDLFWKSQRMSLESTLNIHVLCHVDGAICKTEKSILTHLLEKEVQST